MCARRSGAHSKLRESEAIRESRVVWLCWRRHAACIPPSADSADTGGCVSLTVLFNMFAPCDGPHACLLYYGRREGRRLEEPQYMGKLAPPKTRQHQLQVKSGHGAMWNLLSARLCGWRALIAQTLEADLSHNVRRKIRSLRGRHKEPPSIWYWWISMKKSCPAGQMNVCMQSSIFGQ